jgi:hypothetical protein
MSFFAKYHVMNHMTLSRNGRVLVVRCHADWRVRSNSLGMAKCECLRTRDASLFQDWLSFRKTIILSWVISCIVAGMPPVP